MIVGIDLGYSTVKAVTPTNRVKIPSIVGSGRERNYISSMEGDIELELEGNRYFVGNLAKRESFDYTMAFQRDKSTHENTKVLLLAALAQLSKHDYIEVRLTTGLPISDYKEHKERYSEAIKGEYHIKFNGKEKLINIKEALVFPQALGALFAVNTQIINTRRVGIIDIGFKTTDFAVVENGLTYIDKLSRSLEVGISTAYEIISTEQNVDFYEIEFCDEEANKKIAKKIRDSIHRVWRDIYFDEVYLCGGGGIALAKHFDAILMRDAQFKNAEGFLVVSKTKFGG